MSALPGNGSRVLFSGVLIFLLSSCGGGSSDKTREEVGTPLVLEDTAGLLENIGVTSLDGLAAKVADSGAMALTLELTSADPALKVESVVRLLKKNNRNIEYKKLENIGVSKELVAKISEIPLSPVALKNSFRLPDTSIFPMPDITDQAIDLFNEEKLSVLNRKLRLADQSPITLAQFQKIQSAFDKVDIIDNYGELDQQFQNVIVKDDTSAGKSGASTANRNGEWSLPGYKLGNYADEEAEIGLDPDHPFADICYMSSVDLPMVVATSDAAISSNLVNSESGNSIIKLPQPGIALFEISSDSAVQLQIEKSDGSTLVNQSVSGTYYVHLPVTADQTCQPFSFIGASQNFSIKLIDVKSSERFGQHFYFEGNEYLSSGEEVELLNSNAFFNAHSYTFSSIHSMLNNVELLFKTDSASSAEVEFDLLVFAPSGSLFSATQSGVSGYQFATGLSSEITRENGVWRIDLLPAGSIQTSENEISAVTAIEARDNDSNVQLSVMASVNTDKQVQTREYMLGLLKNVSFKTQGDDGSSNEGEVSLTLNTSMAPKLNVPSYLEDLIERDGTMNDFIALWQCWEKSEKTGTEFEVNQECYEYRDEFQRRQDLYESIRNNRYDPQNDPIYYQCRDENGDDDVCIRGVPAPYDIEFPSETYKVLAVMNDYAQSMNREYHDVEYLNILSSYYDLYLNWKSRSVQIETGKFPYDGLAYKTREKSICDLADEGCQDGLLPYFYSPVIIDTNRPIFGVPVDRVNETTLPLTFDYTAYDQDEYDTTAELFAVLSYAATQTFNIATGNFLGLVCESVALVDDLHELEMDAEADPLGSARVTINRYSSSDPFYGLHNAKNYNFFMSGVPENNTEVDTHGQKLNYAQLACGVGNLATSGYNFYKGADFLVNLDYAQFGEHADLVRSINGIAAVTGSALLAQQADEIATLIESGQIDEAKQRLMMNSDISNLADGTDLYADLDSLLNSFSDVGSAANGNNVIKSNAHYLLGEGKKTRAEVEFQRIKSVPVNSLSVMLDRVTIISNYESDDDSSGAEIRLLPYVGLISDKPRGGLNTHTLFSDEDDGSNAELGYLRFNHVEDGDVITPAARLFSSQGSNVAAIYVELAVTEDDGFSVEDDDMIGVFSQTFKLEEIFNTHAEFKWDYLGGDQYRLVIEDFPVYNSSNQRTLENPLSDDYALQKKHNRNRSPAALVSLTINLTVGDLSIPYPAVDTSLNLSEVNSGKDTYSMEMNEVNSVEISDMFRPKLFDVHAGKAIVSDGNAKGVVGAIFQFDAETAELSKLFDYDIRNFSGDLLPIQAALTADKTISGYVDNGAVSHSKILSLFKLLPDNRLLFAISGDDGARLMIVSYTEQGVMTLENSLLLEEEDGSTIYSLLEATLSPDRSGLLVPYISESYRGSDKYQAAYPKVMYFQLDENNFNFKDLLENSTETISFAEFIDNNSVVITAHKLQYASSQSTVWDWMNEWQRDFQASCSSEIINCYFEKLDRDIFIYQINDSQQLELKDTFNHYVAPMQYGNGQKVNSFATLRRVITDSSGYMHAKTISTSETSAVLKYHKTVYELWFDRNIDGYVKSGSSSLSPRKHIVFNPVSLYYCAEGLSCSGYLQSAHEADEDDLNTYVSEQRVLDFEFADYERDLVLSVVEGTRLALLNLYGGDAYKGPQMSGDIFDTEVKMDGSNDTDGKFLFSFNVSDRDTRIDQLEVTITGQDDPFDETIKEPNRKGNPVYYASCYLNDNDEGVCDATLSPDYYNGSFKQLMTVTVDDGLYTSEREFTLFFDREVPVLNDVTHTVQLESPIAYEELSFIVDSDTSPASSPLDIDNCSYLSDCHLRQNGYVDEWSWTNNPAWLNCSEITARDGNQVLSCSGRPPLGFDGTTMMQITGSQLKGTAHEKSDSMMLTIEVVTPDTTADAFNFQSKGDIELDTMVVSNTVTISGLTGFASLSLDKGEYWRSSTGVWSSENAINIVNDESIKLRLTSSSEYSTATTATVIIGGITAEFTVNTEVDPNANDTTPDAFSFLAITDQDLSTLVQSNSIVISGINEPSPVTVINGEYKIGLHEWTQQAGEITNGENILVRHTTADSHQSLTTTQLTIGGVSADFRATTGALTAPQLSTGGSFIDEPMLNDFFEFTPVNSGGAIESWSITNKPDWATFDTDTGYFSGTVTSSDTFTIEMTATNAAGSDTFTTTVMVIQDTPPYINGYASDCSIDDDSCDYSFTDNANWRSSVTLVTIGEPYGGGATTTLSSPADYELTAGLLRLHLTANNNMVKSGGDYEINIQAGNYNDVNVSIHVNEGNVVITNVDIQPPLAAGTVSTFTLHAANRFDVPVDTLYPELTQVNIDDNLAEQYQFRQATDYGNSNIWRTFGGWNDLQVDANGDVTFDVKLPGCIDINDGFDLIAGNSSWIYRNSNEACIDVDWAVRYQFLSGDNRNIVVDSLHQMYRVNVDDYQLYLTKYDRNGIEKWVKPLTSDGRSWFEGIEIYNDQLYITGSTNGDIDGAGNGQIMGSYDLFVQRLDLEGELIWSRQFGTDEPDYTYGMSIKNDLINVLARINTQPNMSGNSVIYQMDTDGNNLSLILDQSTLSTGNGGYSPMQVGDSGNYYLNNSSGLRKYGTDGSLIASNADFTSSTLTDILLNEDALYLSMNATEAYDGESWNVNEAKAVRVVRLRTSDLSVVWSKLIQSDAPYSGLENSNGQLAFYNGVVYLSVVANKELYYQGLALAETPNYSLNLIALNADGEDDGTGVNNGNGYILAHKSWVTGPVHATDDREDPFLANIELTVSSTGWLHLSLNAKQNFVSTGQMGRSQSSPYPYYSNYLLIKTSLDATSIPLSFAQTGISRNAVTGFVTDFDHQLMWDDTSESADQSGDWNSANTACAALDLGGFDDWRLPWMEESNGQGGDDEMSREGYVPVPGSAFSYFHDAVDEVTFWSASVVDEGFSHVAMIFGSWGDGFGDNEVLNYRCVRTMQ